MHYEFNISQLAGSMQLNVFKHIPIHKNVSWGSSIIDPASFTIVDNTDKKVPQVIIGFQPEYSAKTVDPAKSEVSINILNLIIIFQIFFSIL